MRWYPHEVTTIAIHYRVGYIAPWCWCDPDVYFTTNDDGQPYMITVHDDGLWLSYAMAEGPERVPPI